MRCVHCGVVGCACSTMVRQMMRVTPERRRYVEAIARASVRLDALPASERAKVYEQVLREELANSEGGTA